jgi:pimeloyl-ACP methyl ester carboxylesterase
MNTTKYRKVDIDGFGVAYREAGAVGAPALLLLHGFPTSSDMFRNLMPKMADRMGAFLAAIDVARPNGDANLQEA